MNVLVMGGSYFLGRNFVNKAHTVHKISVYNRGNVSLNLSGVTEIKGDRHDASLLNQLKGLHFDAVIDFCAYSEGDIEAVCNIVGHKDLQYVYISTVDAYKRGQGVVMDESSPFETIDYGGDTGKYILGKALLEREIVNCHEKYGISYTVFRPAFIYGPGNYAPREGIYFNWINQAGQIIHPTNATGRFQMVYVEDVAGAILAAIGNPLAYNEAFNMTGSEIITYDYWAKALAEVVSIPFTQVEVTVETIEERQIPLPFPLTESESHLCKGTKVLGLIDRYTPLLEGLKTLLK